MEEVRYFRRLSLYALAVGIAYWFLSYEAAGTMLLIGFGLATGAGFLVLRSGAREAPADGAAGAEGDPRQPDGPFADESGPVPTRSGAPLAVGFGVAAVALAGAFGPWFIIAGAVPLLLGAADWLRAAQQELALRTSADDELRRDGAGAAGQAERGTGQAPGGPRAADLPARDRPATDAANVADASSRR